MQSPWVYADRSQEGLVLEKGIEKSNLKNFRNLHLLTSSCLQFAIECNFSKSVQTLLSFHQELTQDYFNNLIIFAANPFECAPGAAIVPVTKR